MGWLDKLLFWRHDDPDFEVEGCFTLPGAGLDGQAPTIELDEACETPALDD